ncbi:MAG: hypothetical protein ACR2NW_05920 [Thermodesulfobacteriota bacterium]
MGLSNMLSKLFNKEGEDVSVQNPVKFKDFDSIILPPEPKTKSVLIYKSINLGLEIKPKNSTTDISTVDSSQSEDYDNPIDITENVSSELVEEEN